MSAEVIVKEKRVGAAQSHREEERERVLTVWQQQQQHSWLNRSAGQRRKTNTGEETMSRPLLDTHSHTEGKEKILTFTDAHQPASQTRWATAKHCQEPGRGERKEAEGMEKKTEEQRQEGKEKAGRDIRRSGRNGHGVLLPV